MKPFEEYTIKEVLAMGYKITFEAPIVKGPWTGVHMHVPDKEFEVSEVDAEKIKEWLKKDGI